MGRFTLTLYPNYSSNYLPNAIALHIMGHGHLHIPYTNDYEILLINPNPRKGIFEHWKKSEFKIICITL
jgi:predicted phosphodiesterase